ncbi:MAG: AAA-like domain-containing protein [Cyanobacteriota bacterium]|jgi:hypothetical protein
MKPADWEPFLKDIAQTYGIQGKIKEIFFTRFAYENWRKSDLEIWELAGAPSHETYKKQMTQIYGLFAQNRPQGCPELDPSSKGPGKFQILREWFKEVLYPQWQREQAPTAARTLAPSAGDGVYIPRPPLETEALQELLKPGALIRLKAPEKMGKTTLAQFLLKHLQGQGYRVVYLNFQSVESALFKNLDKFLRWFCANISRELGLAPQLDDYWDEDLFGSLVSCKTYVQSCFLTESAPPLVLALDNLDRLFDYGEIAQDVLPMLRYWHEEANNTPQWRQLRLLIANSTEAYFKLDANQSPFNVGRAFKLEGFTLSQTEELAQSYLSSLSPETWSPILPALRVLVAGHPYLLHLALQALQSPQTDPQTLLAEAPTQGGIYGDHLRRHWSRLQSAESLRQAMAAVVGAGEPIALEPSLAYQLESLGLITLQGALAQVSCPLYNHYFTSTL